MLSSTSEWAQNYHLIVMWTRQSWVRRNPAAKFGSLLLYENGSYRNASLHNAPPAYAEARKPGSLFQPHPNSALGRVARTREVVHITDDQLEPRYPGPSY
jgi:hypothetical protein